MKILLLWLLVLLGHAPATGPAPVRVTFSPLTKVAYLAAKKAAVSTKPIVAFPLEKVRGRIVIPTVKGPNVFQDKGIGTDDIEQGEYLYQGYLTQFGYHVIEAHLYERTQWYLLNKQDNQLALYATPVYSPNLRCLVVASAGIEYGVYPNEIQLFRFNNNQWQLVWQLKPSVEPATWEPDEIDWLSDSTLLLKKKMWTGSTPGNTFTYSKLTIR